MKQLSEVSYVNLQAHIHSRINNFDLSFLVYHNSLATFLVHHNLLSI
jgi:hypothetical protein